MAQPLSIEDPAKRYLITSRTAGSKLWFVNNPELESEILGSLARYQNIHEAVIFGFILMGNHYHLLAQFPKRNRAAFMRDLNASIARSVKRHVEGVIGRRSVWDRRYARQELPNDEDLMHWFQYVSLNPVSSGLTRSMEEYPCYNSVFDSMDGRIRKYRWVDYTALKLKRRTNPNADPEDFAIYYELKISRLPHLAHLDHSQYKVVVSGALKARRDEMIRERERRGRGFLGLRMLKKQVPGSLPKHTKSSLRHSFRPLVLSLCKVTKERVLREYFAIRDRYIEASRAFRAGAANVKFPIGCYTPCRFVAT